MADNAYGIPLLTPAEADKMKSDSAECIELTRQCQEAPAFDETCSNAQLCWGDKLIEPFNRANRNNYDIRRPCNFSEVTDMCYDMSHVAAYLDLDEVREMIHTSKEEVPSWVESSGIVGQTFGAVDWSLSYHTYVADMLNDGLRVLVYAGDADYMCNWQGNRAWTLALDWRGKDGFNAAEERSFVTKDALVPYSTEVVAGQLRVFDNFAFLRVFNAGHMVPMDQPAVALELLNKFLTGSPY
jgi:carboxypeptidase C (cathepsin A)